MNDNLKEPISHTDRLIRDLVKAGGLVNKLAVHNFDGMNGYIATDDIVPGEVIIFVPLEMIITTEVTKHSETWQSLDRK